VDDFIIREGGFSAAFSLTWDRGTSMDRELLQAMARLAKQGIRVDVHPNGSADVLIAELPNGNRYEVPASGLVKLRNEGKLNAGGILEVARLK
jgi:hypothetical protein